jgi:hypothetical protein
MNRSVEQSRERSHATRADFESQLATQQEAFLKRFQTAMNEAVGVIDAQEKEGADRLRGLWNSWKTLNDANRTEEGAEQCRARLENISNSWMVVTVATLDHQSRDVIAKIAATAEKRLREATSEVFARFGDNLREHLQQIATGLEKPAAPPKYSVTTKRRLASADAANTVLSPAQAMFRFVSSFLV